MDRTENRSIGERAAIGALTLADLRTRPTVTIEQAGAVLGLSRTSAYAAASRNEIPHIAVGRRLIVPTEALLRMLEPESAHDDPAA